MGNALPAGRTDSGGESPNRLALERVCRSPSTRGLVDGRNPPRETGRVIYSPASQLIRLGDVGVDHQGAAEGRRQGATSEVGQLCPLDGQDGLSGAVELLRLCVETQT